MHSRVAVEFFQFWVDVDNFLGAFNEEKNCNKVNGYDFDGIGKFIAAISKISPKNVHAALISS